MTMANSPTVHSAFIESASIWHARPFLHVTDETARNYTITSSSLTYAQAAIAVAAIAERYRAAGYGTGHRVGLMLQNRPAMFLHWFALNGLGASVVPLNPELPHPELAYLVQHSGLCLTVGPTNADSDPMPPAPYPARTESAGPTTECALLYTSGTTGKPKGCVLSNDYFLNCGRWYNSIG